MSRRSVNQHCVAATVLVNEVLEMLAEIFLALVCKRDIPLESKIISVFYQFWQDISSNSDPFLDEMQPLLSLKQRDLHVEQNWHV